MFIDILFRFRLIILLLWIISIHWNIGWVVVATEDVKSSPDAKILCDLPLLGPSGYVSSQEDGQGLIFYWNLCPKNGINLEDLNPKCNDGDEATGDGAVCITKVTITEPILAYPKIIRNEEMCNHYIYTHTMIG